MVSRVVDGNEANSFNELNLLKNSDPYKNLRFYLWYVYIMDYDPFAKGASREPQYIGIMLKEDPGFITPNIMTFPQGNYLCFRCRYRQNDWDPSNFLAFFSGRPAPSHILALEYELSLKDFSNSVFDIQGEYK